MSSAIIDAIIELLRRSPATSAEIASYFGCDRSTVTRQLKMLETRFETRFETRLETGLENKLVTTGRARSTRYYLQRGAVKLKLRCIASLRQGKRSILALWWL